MAGDDVVGVVLAAATFFEIFSTDSDTKDNADERHGMPLDGATNGRGDTGCTM